MGTTTTTTTDLVPVLLSPDQLRVIHAALFTAADTCRDRELHFLEMHESPNVGPVTSDEAWQTFKAWEARENACCRAIGVIQAAATTAGVELGFRDYGIR
jgi:hypothetical protein